MQKENDNYLTVKEIAKKTNLTQGQLYTILHYDRLEHETIGGRIVIPKKAFNDWEKANIKPAGKDVSKK